MTIISFGTMNEYIIKCKGNDIIENWDDVLAVAFDTCFVDCESEQGFLIRE